MIYLDNAATTFPKPLAVKRAMLNALDRCGNPGRGGHPPGREADRILYDCRVAVAELFGITDEAKVIFTQNATHALNIAIKSVLHGGGHAVIGGYEHNSVVRPLVAMPNVTYDIAYSTLFDSQDAYEKIAACMKEDTNCVILNHISNVFGNVLPIERIDALCHEKGIPLILDVSQSAGNVKLNAATMQSVSFLCMPGHKGLYGPSGTGILICCKEDKLYSLIEGGTGSNSSEFMQPEFLPDMLESGTPNFVGIAGLLEGVRYVKHHGEAAIAKHKQELIEFFHRNMAQAEGVQVFYDKSQRGLISFTAQEKNQRLFEELTARGFCLRSGMHCAPIAHKSAGTEEFGTIRVSFSRFNNKIEVANLVKVVNFALKSL